MFKRSPWNTLKILISVLKHSAQHITVRLLQGVAWNELLIGVPPSPVLHTLILWELAWARVSVRFICCSLHASREQLVSLGLHMCGVHVSGNGDPRKHGNHSVEGKARYRQAEVAVSGLTLCFNWRTDRFDFLVQVYGVLRSPI